jgi:aminopeptidase-like protein
LTPGFLELSHALFSGIKSETIFFSSYVCHPSLANNELSGPIVLSALMEYIRETYPHPKFTYRFVLLPETIGSITYLAHFGSELASSVIAGFNLSCVGDDNAYSVIHSPYGNTIADRALKAGLLGKPCTTHYSFLDRGSDERQYCSPGFRLPLCTFCRSKFGNYPEYHTSFDNLEFISENGLQGSLSVLKTIVDAFELGLAPNVSVTCEPQLGKRGLYHNLSSKYDDKSFSRHILNFLAYSDGYNDLFDLAILLNVDLPSVVDLAILLQTHKLIYFEST